MRRDCAGRGPSRSVHRNHGRSLRGGAAVARERAARRLRVGGQMRDTRRRRRRLSGDCGGGCYRRRERDRFVRAKSGGCGGARGPAKPPAEHVLRARRDRLDGRYHRRRYRCVPHVVIEAAAPFSPAEYAAEFAVHAPVAVCEQYGRDDGVRGQREQRGQRAGRWDAAAAFLIVGAAGKRWPVGQLEHGVRRPACGRSDDD